MLKKFLALTVMTAAFGAQAQPYIGGTIGYGETGKSTAAFLNQQTYNRSVQNTKSETLGGFFGFRDGWLAAEIGVLQLPKYRGSFDTSDYPAYKGLPPGTYPQTAGGVQSIDATSFYLRGLAYGPNVFGVQTFLSAGVAFTRSHNVEQALYNGVDRATNDITFWSRRPIIGLGVEVGPMRIEYIRINGATDNPHTLKRDVQMMNASFLVRF